MMIMMSHGPTDGYSGSESNTYGFHRGMKPIAVDYPTSGRQVRLGRRESLHGKHVPCGCPLSHKPLLSPTTTRAVTLRICHYSDLENAVDDPERVGRVAALLDRLRDRGPTLVVDGGDVLGPSLLGLETDGAHVSHTHAALGTDLATIGNHDLDYGIEALLSVARESPATYLSANLQVNGAPLAEEPGVRQWAVRELGGQRVVLTGVTSRRAVEDHWVADEEPVAAAPPEEAVRTALASARAERGGFNHAVVVSHCGHRDDRIPRTCEVDAVLGGHVHDRHREWVAGTLVARPGSRGDRVLEVRLETDTADAAGGREMTRRTDAGADTGDAAGVTARSRASAGESPSETAVGTLRSLRSELGLTETVATLNRPVDRSREHLFPESRVGNLVANAFRRAGDADVALFNAGLLRAGPPLSGAVTVADCRSLAPFDNRIHTTTLAGAELRRLFANCTGLSDGLADGAVHAHVSGAAVEFEHDPSAAEPWRLTAVTVDGDPVDHNREYVVAAPSFAFHADAFEPLAPDRIEATHTHQHDALETHLREAGGRVSLEGRIAVCQLER